MELLNTMTFFPCIIGVDSVELLYIRVALPKKHAQSTTTLTTILDSPITARKKQDTIRYLTHLLLSVMPSPLPAAFSITGRRNERFYCCAGGRDTRSESSKNK